MDTSSQTTSVVECGVAVEREACAKIAEGRAIWHRHERHVVQAREAQAIADAIRSRALYPTKAK